MTTRNSNWPEGTPCWVDLGVDDFDKAKAFYGHHGRPRGLLGLHPRADVRVVSRCHAAPGTTCRFPHQSPTAPTAKSSERLQKSR